MTASLHRVRVQLGSGPVEQTCPDEGHAVDLFDRLRRLAPAVRIERLSGARVIEVGGLS